VHRRLKEKAANVRAFFGSKKEFDKDETCEMAGC
jgi:hypothetical protein